MDNEEIINSDQMNEIHLDVDSTAKEDGETEKKKKKPKRILYFSDGFLEEYSSDEEGVTKINQSSVLVDPRTMSWVPWFWYLMSTTSSKALTVCDTVGETLAHFFGITGPKYLYEIEEAERMRRQELEEKKAEELEMAGWNGEPPQAGRVSSVGDSVPQRTEVPVCVDLPPQEPRIERY